MAKQRGNKADRRRRKWFTALSVFLVLVLLHFCIGGERLQPILDAIAPAAGTPGLPSETGALEVVALDVGQGDSIFLQSTSGKTMLIDAGESKAFDAIDDFLQLRGVSKLDMVIATHPHSDHIGGMRQIIKKYDISRFYMPEVAHTTVTYEKMLAALDDRGVEVRFLNADAYLPWDDDVEISVLSPLKGVEYNDLNDWSAIIRVKFGDTAILFTGDAEANAERLALNAYGAQALEADVLKLGHHGSSTSTGNAFLDAVNPRYAIASLGADNDYGHPHQETLQKLKDAGIELFRTDKNGNIRILLTGRDILIEPGYTAGRPEK